LHLLVYLLKYMKMHGPGNIKFKKGYSKSQENQIVSWKVVSFLFETASISSLYKLAHMTHSQMISDLNTDWGILDFLPGIPLNDCTQCQDIHDILWRSFFLCIK
jgi:hypothetical protein